MQEVGMSPEISEDIALASLFGRLSLEPHSRLTAGLTAEYLRGRLSDGCGC